MSEPFAPKVQKYIQGMQNGDSNVVFWRNFAAGRNIYAYFDKRLFAGLSIYGGDFLREAHEQVYGMPCLREEEAGSHFVIELGRVNSSDDAGITAEVSIFADKVFELIHAARSAPQLASGANLLKGRSREGFPKQRP